MPAHLPPVTSSSNSSTATSTTTSNAIASTTTSQATSSVAQQTLQKTSGASASASSASHTTTTSTTTLSSNSSTQGKGSDPSVQVEEEKRTSHFRTVTQSHIRHVQSITTHLQGVQQTTQMLGKLAGLLKRSQLDHRVSHSADTQSSRMQETQTLNRELHEAVSKLRICAEKQTAALLADVETIEMLIGVLKPSASSSSQG